jgi:hypothetical protein
MSKQHYFPRFWLDNFGKSGNGDAILIWQWDKLSNKCAYTSTRNVCHEGNFYDAKLADGTPFLADKVIGEGETSQAPYFNSLCSDPSIQNLAALKTAMAKILATQLTRSKRVRKRIEEQSDEQIKDIFVEAGAPRDAPIGATAADDRKIAHAIIMGTEHAKVEKEILDANWSILRNKTGLPFCIADEPFHIEDAKIYVPLTTDVALLLEKSYRLNWQPSRNISERELKQINQGQVLNAERFVYSPESEFRWASRFLGFLK